jgi:hypothetical protein
MTMSDNERILIEALRKMIDVGMEYYDMDMGQNGVAAIEQAQSAIAKATGAAHD